MLQKITTIEELAVMIQQTMASKEDIKELRIEMNERFEKVDERFEKVDERFEKVDERFEKMDEHFDHLDARVSSFLFHLHSTQSRD